MTDLEEAALVKEWSDLIERCLYESRGLNEWEYNFLESVSDQLTNRGTLSREQRAVLVRIDDEKVR